MIGFCNDTLLTLDGPLPAKIQSHRSPAAFARDKRSAICHPSTILGSSMLVSSTSAIFCLHHDRASSPLFASRSTSTGIRL
jgi:hypothetical protein